MRKIIVYIICVFFSVTSLFAQEKKDKIEKMTIDGEIVSVLITETDTLVLADLEDVSITQPRKFASRKERLRYYKLRRSADKVYPYAAEAIKIFRELENETVDMNKRKRKKHIKKLQKDLKDKFSSKLKNLTKTEGKVLIKMIEKDLDTPFYTLLRNLRGSMTAFYWHQLGKMYSYDLKEGYRPEKDPLLDGVLEDYKIEY